MTTINNVDFDDVIKEAIKSAKAVVKGNKAQVQDIIENLAKGIVNDVEFIAKMKAEGVFNENDARVYLEDQKMLARMRLRSIAIISLQIAERIWNAISEVFRSAINKAIGWSLF